MLWRQPTLEKVLYDPKDIYKKKPSSNDEGFCGAKDEIRTRDPDLGKVVLYQLSYFRVGLCFYLTGKPT